MNTTDTRNPKGAGRKPTPDHLKRVRTQVSLPPDLLAKFKDLGGSRWLQRKIKEETDKNTTSSK